MNSLCLTVILCLISQVLSQKVGIQSCRSMACWNSATKWDFGCGDSIPCLCTNQPFLGSALQCVRERMEDELSISQAYQYISYNCKYNGFIEYSFGALDDIYFNASQYMIKHDLATTLMNSKIQIKNPVTTEPSVFNIQFRAAYAAKHQYDLGTIFGCIVVGYWILILVIGMVQNFLAEKYPELIFVKRPTITSIRKHCVLPATFSGSHNRELKFFSSVYLAAPTRGQSLVLLGYFLLNIVLILVNYDVFIPNPFLVKESEQRMRYLGNRTGIIAFTQLPITILFACRNNILINITGWPYDTFQLYHRWTARVMMIHAFIHSVCFTVLAVEGQTVAYRWQEVINWRFGNMATYAGCIIIVVSFHSIRDKYYEFFYLSHKLFYIIFMIGIFRHCWDFGWMGWVYASITIHVLERLLRLWRIVLSGFKNEAHFLLFDDNSFRMSIKYSKRWKIEPGQYCYVRILTKNFFWQAHPFSIYASPDTEDTNIHLVIKAKGGATAKIAQYLAEQPNNSATHSVIIEGPYGYQAPLEIYDNVLLVAGGIGITATYSYAMHLKRLAKPDQKIVFYWIIRNSVPLEWFRDELRALASDSHIELRVHITAHSENYSATDSGKETDQETLHTVLREKDGDLANIYDSINDRLLIRKALPGQQITARTDYISYDKPSIRNEVRQVMATAKGSLGIMSCGPPLLVDRVRFSIVDDIEKADGRVDYYEESFCW